MQLKFLALTSLCSLIGLRVFAQTPTQDCVLSGEGKVYVFESGTNSYRLDPSDSFKLDAIRFPIGNRKYLFKETKTYSNGQPNETTMFTQTMATGSFSYIAPDGSLKTFGVCTKPGHCSGVLEVKGHSLHFSTNFDATGIRTVSFGEDGSFVDEV